jgi:hypothetical protein
MTSILLTCLLFPSVQWTPLFDAKAKDQFVQRGGQAEFAIEGNTVTGKTVAGTPNSFLCTQQEFGDFELEYEVFVDPTLNSGVQIRSNSVLGYKDGVVHGYQIEIDPTDATRSGGLYDESRRGWLQDPSTNPSAPKAFQKGQWNKFRVVAKGDHIQSWVNGKPVTDFHDDLTRKGFIALQVHSSDKSGQTVKWRNVRIKDLGIPESNPPKGGHWILHQKSDLQNFTSQGRSERPNPWIWKDDAMETDPGKGGIESKEKFKDMQLHLEFMVDENGKTGQENGNSGVYLAGSYEVQILNSVPRGPLINECGAIYNIKAPDYAMAKPAGQWQTYDITFTAPKYKDGQKVANARITAYHNGTLIHKDVEVPHETGSGRPESDEPKGFTIQDHGHRIRFRNIWVK